MRGTTEQHGAALRDPSSFDPARAPCHARAWPHRSSEADAYAAVMVRVRLAIATNATQRVQLRGKLVSHGRQHTAGCKARLRSMHSPVCTTLALLCAVLRQRVPLVRQHVALLRSRGHVRPCARMSGPILLLCHRVCKNPQGRVGHGRPDLPPVQRVCLRRAHQAPLCTGSRAITTGTSPALR